MHTQRFASKPEAITFMAKLQRDTAPLANSKLTIGEWIDHWFDNHGVAWERSITQEVLNLLEHSDKRPAHLAVLTDRSAVLVPRADATDARGGIKRPSKKIDGSVNHIRLAFSRNPPDDCLRETSTDSETPR